MAWLPPCRKRWQLPHSMSTSKKNSVPSNNVRQPAHAVLSGSVMLNSYLSIRVPGPFRGRAHRCPLFASPALHPSSDSLLHHSPSANGPFGSDDRTSQPRDGLIHADANGGQTCEHGSQISGIAPIAIDTRYLWTWNAHISQPAVSFRRPLDVSIP